MRKQNFCVFRYGSRPYIGSYRVLKSGQAMTRREWGSKDVDYSFFLGAEYQGGGCVLQVDDVSPVQLRCSLGLLLIVKILRYSFQRLFPPLRMLLLELLVED